MADEKPDKPTSRTVRREAHWIEWATGIVATLAVAAMIVWITYHAATTGDGTPFLKVTIVDQQPVAGGFRVSFNIENSGTRTAAAVPVTGELRDDDRMIERQEVTFDYVPAQSRASGALMFSTDPSVHDLAIVVSGYVDP